MYKCVSKYKFIVAVSCTYYSNFYNLMSDYDLFLVYSSFVSSYEGPEYLTRMLLCMARMGEEIAWA